MTTTEAVVRSVERLHELLVVTAGSTPRISTAQLHAGRTGGQPEYNPVRGLPAGAPSENLHPPIPQTNLRRQPLAEWIGTAAPPAVLDEFLAGQTADFTMVSTDGQVLGLAELRVALAGAGGADPGLKIAISEVEIVGEFGDALLVRFREDHSSDRGSAARRVSAVLVPYGPGLQWRHLHETPIAG